jgi:hypothetical protein
VLHHVQEAPRHEFAGDVRRVVEDQRVGVHPHHDLVPSRQLA